MPEITFDTMLDGWVRESGKGFPYPPPDFYSLEQLLMDINQLRRRAKQRNGLDPWGPDTALKVAERKAVDRTQEELVAAWNQENPPYRVQVTEEGAITVRPERGRTRPVMELGRILGKAGDAKSFALLNGDGFDDRNLQRIQARVRNLVAFHYRRNAQRLIVPYAALNAAELNLASIRPIHIAGDRQSRMQVEVAKVPDRIIARHGGTVADPRRRFEHNGRRYESVWTQYPPTGGYVQDGVQVIRVIHTAEFSPNEEWHVVTIAEDGKWYVTERVHRLGAAVFWAESQDGVRHRWISSFDQNEDPPMYFLAQLPDKGGVRYVTHAERLLAPKIVQKARADGRRVFRQGDIFVVETDLTDEDFSPKEVTRRTDVFDYPQEGYTPLTKTKNVPWVWASSTSPLALYIEHAIADKDPHNLILFTTSWLDDIRRPWQLQSPMPPLKSRRGIMVYGTGHTASVVAQTERGTFVKGVMYHDPILENIRARRQPEHRPLPLTEGKWFLAVRNTVPRLNNTDTGGNNATSTR